jgi:ribosome-associated translation inhibitor RaiA
MQQTTATEKNRNQPEAASDDLDLKAYIYQQLADLQPYLIADSQMAVSVHQVSAVEEVDVNELDAEEQHEIELEEIEEEPTEDMQPEVGDYVVRLTTTLEGGKLVAQGHGEDVFEAFGVAKGAMVQQLSQLQNALMDQSERDTEIQNYLNGSKTLH